MYFTDEKFMSSEAYKQFIKVNTGKGKLKIRAYAASEALPVEGLNITVSSIIGNKKIIFFEGITDSSGMVENITLPAPELNINNMEIPNTIEYEIDVKSSNQLQEQIYHVNMYDGICVVQNINYVPSSFGGVINGY